MPKNDPKIKAKQIKGKKIREQYLDGLLWGLLIGIVMMLLISLLDMEHFLVRVKDILMLVLCFAPVVIFVILNRFCIGKVICVLTDDKIFYFNAFTKIKKHNDITNGYILYSEIKDMIYEPSGLGRYGPPSCVEIYGQDFKITIVNANKSLINKIKKAKENYCESNTI